MEKKYLKVYYEEKTITINREKSKSKSKKN